MLNIYTYEPKYEAARPLVEELRNLMAWVHQTTPDKERVSWVLRYDAIRNDRLDPLLVCGPFIRQIPFEVDYDNRTVMVETTDQDYNQRVRELTYGLGGTITTYADAPNAVEYVLVINDRQLNIDYAYEFVDGGYVKLVRVTIGAKRGVR